MTRDLTLHERINLRGFVEEFPKIGKRQFEERFNKLKIGVSGDLLRELRITAKTTGSFMVPSVLVEINYTYYGMFTSMGVGKGITAEEATIARLVGFKRRKKPWTKGLAHMRYRLGELYAEMVTEEISQHVNQSYDRTIRFKF